MTLPALEALYAAHLATQPVCPTVGTRWPEPHAHNCGCAACDEYHHEMAEWGAEEARLSALYTAAESEAA